MNQTAKKRRSPDLPLCKYGSSCYRKNSEHLKKYRHPDPVPAKVQVLVPEDPTATGSSSPSMEEEISCQDTASVGVCSDTESPSNENSSSKPLTDAKYTETVEEVLKSMPKDFFDFWKFCSSINKNKPEDAFSECGLHLVGIYDLLAKKLPKTEKVLLHCHWRYFYDPPEFQTVIKADGKDLFHVGYFRDDPSKRQSILASNSAALGPKLTLEGDNIFAAMNGVLKNRLKTLPAELQSKFKPIQHSLQKFADEKGYSLECQTQKTKARNKKVVAKTFHGLGIVVPVKNDIGYRPLPDSNARVKTILKRIVDAETEESRLKMEEDFDELMSNVQFANDECDYGMGLEFGLDIFCFGHEMFHSRILHILPLAYRLLNRPKYGEIIHFHLADRKKSDDLSTL